MREGNRKARIVQLGEIAKIVSGGTPSRANPAYWGGDIPWVKTANIRNGRIGADDIDERITEAGLEGSSARVIPAGTILMAMYGQGGTRGRVSILETDAAISQNGAAFILADGVDAGYVFQLLRHHYERLRSMSNAGSLDFLSNDALLSLRIPLPPPADQRRIASILTNWDSAIEKTERLKEAKGPRYEFLVEQLTARADIDTVQVRSLAAEESVRNSDERVALVLSVTNKRGFELPEDRFSKRVASANLGAYKVVRRGQYAYNPSRVNVGSIGRLDEWERCVLSPMYVVFSLDDTKVESDYFLHWLRSSWARGHIVRSAQGSVRDSVGFSDFASIPIHLPSRDGQRRAVRILNSARREINLLTELQVAYTKQRSAMASTLLASYSGEGRALP